jgi:hypothetical protein
MHNVGAAAVVGCPAAAWWLVSVSRVSAALPNQSLATASIRRSLAWLTLLAWSTQIASGAAFGATTYYLKHEFPELTGVGFVALVIKVSCAFICCILTLLYLRTGTSWTERMQLKLWQALFLLGLAALMSAAFLRWYG